MANVQPPAGGDDRQHPSTNRFAPSTGVNPANQRPAAGPRSSGGGPLPLLNRPGGGMAPWVPLAAALVLLLCLCGGITWLVTNSNNVAPTAVALATTVAGARTPTSATALQLGTLQTASVIAADHRPTTVTNTFTTSSTVYAVFAASNIAAGTNLYAQWLHDGQVYDNSAPLIADKAYKSTFVEFHLQPLPGKPYPPGNYTVQVYVNGNQRLQTTFVVR
jgi:hypothetical protein